jgi:tripartite-type tricarboxylate transporter receptor subunit TctC
VHPELVSYAKANPRKVTFASAGSGTTTHLGPELLKREARIDMLHVPYRGAAPAITDVVAGAADVILADAPVVLPYLTTNRLKALAIGTSARSPALPNVPTISEAGFRNVLVSTWYGILVPAKTPREIVVKLNGTVNKVLSGADAKTFYGDQVVQINGGTPEEFGSFIAAETARWSALAKAVGVKMD